MDAGDEALALVSGRSRSVLPAAEQPLGLAQNSSTPSRCDILTHMSD